MNIDDTLLIKATEKHFEAIREKKVEEILNFYMDSDELLVFVEGPRWQTPGFENVARGWRDFVQSSILVKKCKWIEYLRSKIIGDLGFVAGIVEIEAEIEGRTQTIKFRGTFILEKDSQENWKVIHEHFSQPAADPYGVGDWLKKD